MSDRKSKLGIGANTNPFSKPASEKRASEPTLFPKVLKENPKSWVPPLTRRSSTTSPKDSDAASDGSSPNLSGDGASLALPTPPQTDSAPAVSDLPLEWNPDRIAEPHAVQPAFFSELFRLTRTKATSDAGFISGLELGVATAFRPRSEAVRELQVEAERHGLVLRAFAVDDALMMSARPTASTRGGAEAQVLAFAKAIGAKAPSQGTRTESPESEPAVFAVRRAVQILGVKASKTRVRIGGYVDNGGVRYVEANLTLTCQRPPRQDKSGQDRFEEAFATLQGALQLLSNGRSGQGQLKGDWEVHFQMPKRLMQWTVGNHQLSLYSLTNGMDEPVPPAKRKLDADAAFKIPDVLYDWSILQDEWSEPIAPSATAIPARKAPLTPSSLKQVLNAETRFPVFSVTAVEQQFDDLRAVLQAHDPTSLSKHLERGSFDASPFIREAAAWLTAGTPGEKTWTAQQLQAVEEAKSRARDFLAAQSIIAPEQVEAFVRSQVARGSLDGFLSGTVFQAAIEPRRAAWETKDALLQQFRKWDEAMHPLRNARAGTEGVMREALDVYLMSIGAGLSFELTKPTMAHVERMLGGDSKKTSQPLSMSEVGALLDAPHVTTSNELSKVAQLRERELEGALGYSLLALRQMASEAARDDDRFV
jgi:hypothetical protein